MLYCKSCRYRVPEESDRCPLCGGHLSAVPDDTAPTQTRRARNKRRILPHPAASPPVWDRGRRPRPVRYPHWIALTVVFCLAALINLAALLLHRFSDGLGGMVGSVILAQLFYQFSKLPPGATRIQDRSGKSVPLGSYALPRVILAVLIWLVL